MTDTERVEGGRTAHEDSQLVETFDSFYSREYRSILALTNVLVGDRAAAEDLAQEAFIAAFRSWAKISQPEHWIRSVVSKMAMSWWRRVYAERRAQTRLYQPEGGIEEMPAESEGFWAEVRALPARQAQAIALFYMEDRSTGEIGSILGCDDGPHPFEPGPTNPGYKAGSGRMSNLDVIARRHAEEARVAVAGVRPPDLDPSTRKGRITTVRSKPPQPRWVAAAVAVFMVIIIALPLLLRSGEEAEPVTTVPPVTTVAPATTVPNPPPPTSGGFLPAGDLQQGCAWCPGALLQDGRVLVVGGWMRDGDGTRPAAELFDPDSGTFTPTGVPGNDFNQGMGVLLEDGRVLFVFGLSEQAEIYDPVSGGFEPTAITYPQGQGGTATTLGDGNVMLLFGDGTVATYDPTSDALASVGSVPTPVETATLLEDGRVLVTGARTAGVIEPGVFRYQPLSMLTPRSGHTATRLGDGQVLIAGGGNPEEPFEPIPAGELFDPETGGFVATGSLNLPRSLHATALLEDGRVLIVGGTPGTMVGSRTGPGMAEYDHAEIYDPPSGTFSLLDSPMSQPRIAPTVVTLLDGRVLVLGNYPGNVPSADDTSANTSEVFAP